jgi:hypothetical protein
MEIQVLLQYLLPKEVSDYFDLTEVKEKEENQLYLYLDEKSTKPSEHSDKDLIAYGFDEPVCIQDFPIRDKSAYLIVRRKKWKDKQTGKIYSKHWDLTAKGSSYSKEFAAFLKELFGQLPNQQ